MLKISIFSNHFWIFASYFCYGTICRSTINQSKIKIFEIFVISAVFIRFTLNNLAKITKIRQKIRNQNIYLEKFQKLLRPGTHPPPRRAAGR